MESTNAQRSRDLVRRFLLSVGLGFLGVIISFILIFVAHRMLVILGFKSDVASTSVFTGWFLVIGLGFLEPEKEPMGQYLETKLLAYPAGGIVFGLALSVTHGQWEYLPAMLLSLIVYSPGIVLRELSKIQYYYKL